MSEKVDQENAENPLQGATRDVTLMELEAQPSGPRKLDGNLSLIAGVKVAVEVVVGSAELSVEELFSLQDGSVVPLDQLHDAPLSIRLDGKTIADGTLVVVGDNFGVRVKRVLEAPVVEGT